MPISRCTSFSKASSVPGSKHTATLRSSTEAKPRVDVWGNLVDINLSPTFDSGYQPQKLGLGPQDRENNPDLLPPVEPEHSHCCFAYVAAKPPMTQPMALMML